MARRNDRDPHVVNETGRPLSRKRHFLKLDNSLLTSASLHDSQAAIPLATLSAERTTNLYDLMDAAYDAEPIRRTAAHSATSR